MKRILKSTAVLTSILLGSLGLFSTLNNNEVEQVTNVSNSANESIHTYTYSDGAYVTPDTYDAPFALIDSSFQFLDITSTSAKIQFSYFIPGEESLPEDAYIVDPSTDIVFLWDKNGDGDFTLSESYEVVPEGENPDQYWNGRYITYVPTEEVDSNIVKTATYQINGLEGDTTYKDFGIYVKSPESLWVKENWTLTGKTDQSVIEDSTEELNNWFLVPQDIILKTARPLSFYYWIIIFMLLLIVALLSAFVVYKWIDWWHKHMSLALFYDGKISFEQGELVINLLHVNRYSKLWHAHEEDLVLIAAGRALDARFTRTSSVPNGYRIYLTEDTGSKKVVLSMMSASKYNEYYIGIRGHHDTFHAQILSDVKAQKITRLISKSIDEVNDETREMMLQEIVKKTSKEEAKTLISKTGTLAHISEIKSTQTTLRYQLLFPKHHGDLDGFDPEASGFGIYYIYHGKVYKMEHKFMGKYGHQYEFDLINLKPDSIYVGLSVSFDGGKTIQPSSAIYGVTRDKDGVIHTKTHALLGGPNSTSEKTYPMWTKAKALEVLEEEAFFKMKGIITKKHYEDDNEDAFITSERAETIFSDYIDKWIEEAEKLESKAQKVGVKKAPTAEEISKKSKRELKEEYLRGLTKPQLTKLATEFYDIESLKGYTKDNFVELLMEENIKLPE